MSRAGRSGGEFARAHANPAVMYLNLGLFDHQALAQMEQERDRQATFVAVKGR